MLIDLNRSTRKREILLIKLKIQFVPRRKHFISITKPNRLTLFRETVAVYCENHAESVNTLCGQNAKISNFTERGAYNKHNSLKT
jgi:hypothetical protein